MMHAFFFTRRVLLKFFFYISFLVYQCFVQGPRQRISKGIDCSRNILSSKNKSKISNTEKQFMILDSRSFKILTRTLVLRQSVATCRMSCYKKTAVKVQGWSWVEKVWFGLQFLEVFLVNYHQIDYPRVFGTFDV